MNVAIQEVYVAYTTNDEYGRRGNRSGIFTTRSKAEEEAIGIGWWGGTGTVLIENVITVEGKSYLLASPIPVDLNIGSKEAKEAKERLKTSALSKLTSDERKALGV